MKKLWITYAWADNTAGDVDYLAQELSTADIEVKLDKWTLGAGRRLWEQIDQFISSPGESDVWLMFATQNSLGSQACREEYAYALDRALRTRSGEFPVLALFPGPVGQELLPAGIRTRLYVSLTDKDWKERVVAAIHGRVPHIGSQPIEPFAFNVHHIEGAQFRYVVELRPRAGVFAPCFVAVPMDEVERTRFMVPVFARLGPQGQVPQRLHMSGGSVHPSADFKYMVCALEEECTPTRSLFAYFIQLPSHIIFGAHRADGPQYRIALEA
jgi:hypothetical protein